MNDAELITLLREQYGEQIKLTETLPKAYFPGGIEAVKAIYLGCDPTNNSYNIEFEYAFAHEYKGTEFNQFLKMHTDQLKQIGLDWNHVYSQNLECNLLEMNRRKNIKIIYKDLTLFFTFTNQKITIIWLQEYLQF